MNSIILKFSFFLAVLCFDCSCFLAQSSDPENELVTELVHEYMAIKYPDVKMDTFIYVGVERQKMFVFVAGKIQKIYDVSTSKHGAGSMHGSNCTPVGLHRINGKYGESVPKGGVLTARKFTGRITDIVLDEVDTGKDEITSRVITIEGMEVDINKGGHMDSYARQIYIHGTSEEGLIGKPASHGCIRMRNDDVIELFSFINEGAPLIILNN